MPFVPQTTSDHPEAVNTKDQLVEYLADGCKPKENWRIGTEHEKFAFDTKTLKPLPYDGENGIQAILNALGENGWEAVHEGDNLIALKDKTGANVSLEPGGQVELSGAPLETIHQTCAEVNEHLAQIRHISEKLGIGMIGLGFHPTKPRGDIPWMPKGRYKIMREYMPKRGNLGLDMMLRTCTVQVNLDFDSEADMVRKMRVSLALQPIATALFANSPFTEGKPNGFQSFRSHVWTDTDPDRTGDMPFIFEDGFGFERYVDYILDVPMYFVYRDGQYIDAAGQSFRDFMKGELPAVPGEQPRMSDWEDHLTTVFPEVRLKRYIEMRGADGGPWQRLCALPALWVGLLYDETALSAAEDLIKDWTAEERRYLRDNVPKSALETPFRQETVQDIAMRTLEISRGGLERRARLDSNGKDESHFLNPLLEIAKTGETPALKLLDCYENRWNGDLSHIFEEFSY